MREFYSGIIMDCKSSKEINSLKMIDFKVFHARLKSGKKEKQIKKRSAARYLNDLK